MNDKTLYFPSEDENKRVRKLIDELMMRETDPGEVHLCPICGGQIHITFSVYLNKRLGREKLGVAARCEGCHYLSTSDGGPIPKWLKKP